MPLTDAAIRKAKPTSKQYKLTDGDGMYLLVKPSGKYWRYDYRYMGKRKTLALGVYPKVSLKSAREKRREARRLIEQNVDPGHFKKITKATVTQQTENTFKAIALEWYAKNEKIWSGGHAETVISRLEQNVFPWLGDLPITTITALQLLSVLRRVESRGAIEVARRVKMICGQIFRFAIATGRADNDPTPGLRGALEAVKPKSMAAITDEKKIGGLLRAIDGYQGYFVTKCALQLAPLVFVRPGELRKAEWSEIDLDNVEWRIPPEKMKMGTMHIVPLSVQAVEVLKEIYLLTGKGKYVFPSARSSDRPMSENTVVAALRRMGFTKEEMTAHGFRSMASTRLHELGWNSDVIERQLAHAEKNKIKGAYNYAEYLPERRKMMQTWADYLDALKEGAKIIPFRQLG